MAQGSAETPTADAAEIAKFEALAADWWDPDGTAKPLHRMTPCRVSYVIDQIAAEFGRDPAQLRCLDGLDILDVGCGGGLLCEPLTRAGASVTGIDAGAENIRVAQLHATDAGLEIDYHATTAEALGRDGRQFDAVLSLEVVEHVTAPQAFVDACAALVRPGGLLIMSTLNRTARSYALAIVAAETILRWLPRGTHDWSRFVTPDELDGMVTSAGLDAVDRQGMVMNPLDGRWRLSPADLSVNYLITATKGQ